MGACSQMVYNETGPRTVLDICHLCGLGATYPKNVFLLIPMCKWFPIDPTLKHIICLTSTIGNISWTCVYGCKSMWKVCNCGTAASIAKLPQIPKLTVSRFVSLIE